MSVLCGTFGVTGNRSCVCCDSHCPSPSSSTGRLHTVGFEDSEDLVAGDDLDLSDAVAIAQDNTNLRRRSALSCELANVVDNRVWRGLEPCRHCSRVWDGGGTDTLSFAVKTTHGGGFL